MPDPAKERRQNALLREIVQELIGHVRHIARNGRSMPEEELQYAQQRLDWLAEEVWRTLREAEEQPDEESG